MVKVLTQYPMSRISTTDMGTEGSEETATARTAVGATSLSKSAFIRELPSDLRPKEVVSLAKARGIIISVGYVRQVRVAARDRAMRALRNGLRMGPAAAAGPFVALLRSLPADMPYADAAAHARGAGVILSPAYFYALRGPSNAQAAVNSKPASQRLLSFKGIRLASDEGREQG